MPDKADADFAGSLACVRLRNRADLLKNQVALSAHQSFGVGWPVGTFCNSAGDRA